MLQHILFAQIPGVPPAPGGDTYITTLLGWVLTATVLLIVAIGGAIWALITWFMNSLKEQRMDGIAAQERMQAKHDLQMKEANDKHDADMKEKREKHDATEAQSRKEFLEALKEQKEACKEELAGLIAATAQWRAESQADNKQLRELAQLFLTRMAELKIRGVVEAAEGSEGGTKTRRVGT